MTRRSAIVVVVAVAVWVGGESLVWRVLALRGVELVGGLTAWNALVSLVAFPVLAAGVAACGVWAGIAPGDWGLQPSLRGTAAGVGRAVFVRVVTVVAAIPFVLAGAEVSSTDPFGGGVPPAAVLVAFVVGNVITVPFADEIASRGVIQTALTDRFSVGIGVTTAVFVGTHLLVDTVFLPTRVVGLVTLVLGLLRVRYGTSAAIVAHVVANAVGTAVFVAAVL